LQRHINDQKEREMNVVKFYKTAGDGSIEVVRVRVTQRHRELYRHIRVKPTHFNTTGIVEIPAKYPSVAKANRDMLAKGYSRRPTA
jgi:hypothetical protein